MFRMCASNSHSYTHLILALGIVREPTVWNYITSEYPGTHDIGLPNKTLQHEKAPQDQNTKTEVTSARTALVYCNNTCTCYKC